MKALVKLIFAIAILAVGADMAAAQNSKKDKKAATAAKIKAMLDARDYVFEANYVVPQRGSSRALSFGYDMAVSKDTLAIYLPYFGRVTQAPIDPTDGGIKLTTTNFDYKTESVKNGTYNILITPKESATQGSKDIRSIRLSTSVNGYASLQVTSTNRDPISFNGTIEERKPKKTN